MPWQHCLGMEEAPHAQRLPGNSAQHLGLRHPCRGTSDSRKKGPRSGTRPWIVKTQMDRLERAQNQALCRITGQTASSPVEALRIEAGLSSCETVSRQLIATSREKALRCSPSHPRHLALEGEQRHRLCRDSWRESSKRLEASLPEGLAPREPLTGPTEHLWTANPRSGP